MSLAQSYDRICAKSQRKIDFLEQVIGSDRNEINARS